MRMHIRLGIPLLAALLAGCELPAPLPAPLPPPLPPAPVATAIGAGPQMRLLATGPANDEPATARVIAALPYVDVLDTTGATAAPNEPGSCDPPGAGSVWYRFTPTQDVGVRLTTAGSTFTPRLTALVPDGAGGYRGVGFCAEGEAKFVARPGTTYYVRVGWDPARPGAELHLAAEALPIYRYQLKIDGTGSLQPFGYGLSRATITGTLTGDRPFFAAPFSIRVRQKVGHRYVESLPFDTFFLIDTGYPGSTNPTGRFTATTMSTNGTWAGGPAEVTLDGVLIDGDGNGFNEAVTTTSSVRLKPVR